MANIFTKLSLRNLWGWVGGRHFCLAIWFAVTAFVLAWHGILTPQYACVIGALQGLMSWRTVHEDRKEAAMAKATADSTSDATNTTVINVEPATGGAGDKG